MQLARSFSVVVALVTMAALVAGCGGSKTQSGATAGDADEPVAGGGHEIAVAVTDKGFEPSQPQIERGEAVTLVFTRTTDQTCATDVMFPRLGMKVQLPLNEAVRVEIPAGAVEDTLYFACGMNMVSGQIVAQ